MKNQDFMAYPLIGSYHVTLIPTHNENFHKILNYELLISSSCLGNEGFIFQFPHVNFIDFQNKCIYLSNVYVTSKRF